MSRDDVHGTFHNGWYCDGSNFYGDAGSYNWVCLACGRRVDRLWMDKRPEHCTHGSTSTSGGLLGKIGVMLSGDDISFVPLDRDEARWLVELFTKTPRWVIEMIERNSDDDG